MSENTLYASSYRLYDLDLSGRPDSWAESYVHRVPVQEIVAGLDTTYNLPNALQNLGHMPPDR